MASEKYIVYNVNHHGSLLEIISLRYVLNRGDNVILVLAENEGDYYSQRMAEEGIFDKVIMFQISVGMQEEGDKLVKVLNDYFDGLLFKNGINLNDITEVYTQADVYNPFGIFVAIRGKKVTIVEESKNRLSNMEKYEMPFNYKIVSKSYRDIQKKLSILCGEKDKYDLILRSETDDKKYFGFSHKHWSVDYSVCYDFLTPCEKNSIFKSYCVDVEKYNDVDTMLFLNSDGYTQLALDVKIPISDVYTTLADYCSRNGERFIIKPHPDSRLVSENNFPDDEFAKNYPIEVINLLDKIKIKRTISAKTTAVKKIERFVKNDISLGDAFFKTFSHIHKLYVSLSIADFFAKKTEYKVFQNITNDCKYLNNLLKITIPEPHYGNIEYIDRNNYHKPSISIVFDAIELSSIAGAADNIIISFSPPSKCNDYYRTKIILNGIGDGTTIQTDFLYIFTGNNSLTDSIVDLKIEKTLPRRGLKLEASTEHTMK